MKIFYLIVNNNFIKMAQNVFCMSMEEIDVFCMSMEETVLFFLLFSLLRFSQLFLIHKQHFKESRLPLY